ncbi:MAG: hypothetical protein J0H69_17760 [Burkholderiales bacterium]|nr:hypothetical protein [Burkholderiales bacterium]
MRFPTSIIEGKFPYLLLLASAAVPPLVGLVLAPLITAHVTTAEYGSYVAYQTLCGMLNAIAGFSSVGYISNAFIHPQEAPSINASMLTAATGSLPVVALAALWLNSHMQSQPPMLVAAMVAAALMTYVIGYFQAYATLLKRYGYLLGLALAQFGIQAVLVLMFIGNQTLDLDRLVLGHVAGLALATLACLGPVRARLGLTWVRPRAATVRTLFWYGLPLVPHNFLSLATGSFDRWLLAKVDAVEFLAVYGVALSVAAPMYILLDVANKVYSPRVFEQLRDGLREVHHFLGGMIALNAFGIFSATVVGVTGRFFIVHFFGPQYRDAAVFCVPLCFSIAAFSMYYSASPFLYYFNRTRLILAATIAGAATAGVASWFGYVAWGGMGLVAAKAAGFIVCGLAAVALAHRILRANTVQA